MSSLIFESLEIKGFRVFEDLQIKRLGRINLIVGKNNVGKSSLLEALAIYARQGLPQAIWQRDTQRALRVPIREPARSLNLSNTVAIGVFEALRQWGA